MDQWIKTREIIESALELEEPQRSDFISEACAGEADLQSDVEEYLRYASCAGPNLSMENWFQGGSATEEECDPERIGEYRILRRLGEGGMGIVYLAQRDDSEYEQQVALKVLKPGSQSNQALHLFRRERQILANLKHPNIAYLMDGGTVNGRIFYVMELVDGIPITAYCDEHGLSIPLRLTLFCRICEAVSYAHRKLVIHRDLKPNHILVTADGTPKLLDFGLAKVFDESFAEDGGATVSIGPMMTPAYASPEQVRGEPLSTAVDVYSLGVLLYELLVGRNPQASDNKSPLEICRAILNDDPEPPSQAVQPKLRRQFKGDLDKIVLKALCKEPELRYSSVDDLREDIERYLCGFPVRACQGTVLYRCQKCLRRHRSALAVSVFMLALTVSAAVTIWWQGRQAEMRSDEALGLAHSMIFELHEAVRHLPGSTNARKLIVERALEYMHKIEASGAKKRELQLEIASAYWKIGEIQSDNAEGSLEDTAGAVDSFTHARQLIMQILLRNPNDTQAEEMLAHVDSKMANVYEQRGDERSRADLSREQAELLWSVARRHSDNRRMKAAALQASASDRSKAADWKAAQPLWEEAITTYSQAVAQEPNNPDIVKRLANAHYGLAQTCNQLEQLTCARDHYESALRIESARMAAEPDNTRLVIKVSYHLIDLGWIEHRLGKRKDAIVHEKQALALQERVAAADPENFTVRLEGAKTLITTGLIYRDGGDLSNSAKSLQKAIATLKEMLEDDPGNQSTLFHLTWATAELGDVFVRRANDPQGTYTQTRHDWETAATLYERALHYLGKLKLSGKLDGLLDDSRLRAAVPMRLTECRKHLIQLRPR